jgi:hypothetical protein
MGEAVGIDVLVGGIEVFVGFALLTRVSVGGWRVAVRGMGIAVGDGLVPQPLTEKTRNVAAKDNGRSFFILFPSFNRSASCLLRADLF